MPYLAVAPAPARAVTFMAGAHCSRPWPGSAWLGESAEVAADPPKLSDEDLRGLAHHCLERGGWYA